MQHIYNYIIKISNEFNETFQSESGMTWFGNKDFSQDRLSNRYATIVSQPIICDDELLDVGTEILIDPSVYYHSLHGHNDKIQITTNTIDRKKGLYSIEPENIVLYKKNDTWHGYLDNFLGKRIVNTVTDKKVGNVITQVAKKEKTDSFDVVCLNAFLKENDVEVGDRLAMRPGYGVSVWLEGKEHFWLRGVDVLAKYELHAN